jgi:beta-lactamase class A
LAGRQQDWRGPAARRSGALATRTGLGEPGTTNDIYLFWPPQRQPVRVAAYLTETAAVSRAVAEAVVA